MTRLLQHWLAAALCVGVAWANAVRVPSLALLGLAAGVALAAAAFESPGRIGVLALALALAGWWWGSARLDALDRSPLLAEVGTAETSLVAVTGPARRGHFGLRVPAQMRRFGRRDISEPILLELPLGRAPPQGALLEVLGVVALPRGPAHGFDERTWLRRHGVHVVLRGDRWRVVGRRGGLGGLADRIHARLARTLAPGLHGERKAVLEGVVLGDDQGLSDGLRTRFRASGLYHLLAELVMDITPLAEGMSCR